MNFFGDFSAQAHMPKACEAKRAVAKTDQHFFAQGAKQ